MTTPDAELEAMLREAFRLGNGPAKFAALDTVFRHADAAGRTEFAYRARMNAIEEMHNAGEYARAFMAFSRCLSTFDSHPEVTRPGDEHSLLWAFKWIVWELSQFPGVTLEQANALLDDMERRYRAGDHSQHAVHQHRGVMATHLGDLEAAGHWFTEMHTARRDHLSDCQACVPTTEVEFLVAAGRYEDAVRVGSPYTEGGCSEQPHQMLSHLLLPYLHTGRHAEAAVAHRKAYARIRDSRHWMEQIALHVQFCALTGNAEHALPIIERHLPWLDRPASPYAAMEFASAAALALHRLAGDGRGDTPVQRRTDNGDRRWTSTAAETGAELAALARTEAARFDERNRNAYQSGRVEARLAAAPIVATLPLTVLTGRPIAEHPARAAINALVREVADRTAAGDPAGAARLRLEVAYALRNAGQWGDALEAAEEARRSLDQVRLADDALLARYLLVELYKRDWRQRRSARALLDELLAAPRRPEGIPSRALLLEQAAELSEGQDGIALLLTAADLHRDAGDETAEARAVLIALRLAYQPPADWETLVSRVDDLVAAGRVAAGTVPGVQAHLSALECRGGRPEAALARVQRHPGNHPDLRVREARLLLRLGRATEAETLARTLVENDDVSWTACLVIAKSLVTQDREAEAVEFLAEHDADLTDLADYDED